MFLTARSTAIGKRYAKSHIREEVGIAVLLARPLADIDVPPNRLHLVPIALRLCTIAMGDVVAEPVVPEDV